MLSKLKLSKQRRHLHLALGGGGARALAHIGVLKIIEQEKLPIARLSGTSGGAIVAALYAQLGNIRCVVERVYEFLQSDTFKEIGLEFFTDEQTQKRTYFESVENFFSYVKSRLLYSRGLVSESLFPAERLIELLSQVLADGNIEQTRIPLQIAAVNIDTGEDILLDQGSIVQAVAASSAIPGIFSPVEVNGMRLVDGGVINIVPLVRINKLSEVVVGVDVSRSLRIRQKRQTALDYIVRAEEITTYKLNELHLQEAEVLISPEAVRRGHWADFRHPDKYIRSGERAALAKISKIKTAMSQKDSQLRRWLKRKI